jgi:hypothetical protein
VGDIVQFHAELEGAVAIAERGTAGPGWSELDAGGAVTLVWDVADTLVFKRSET